MPRPAFSKQVPQGDTRPRRVCDHCGFIDYVNPRVVVGVVATWDERLLFCRRAIEPRSGFWTLPAGFLEQHETAAEGAAREAREEAGAELEVGPLLGLFDIPRIAQLHLFYRARLISPDVRAGEESLDVALLTWDEVPWTELAFPTVQWALWAWRETHGQDVFTPRATPPGDRGDFPRDWHGRAP
jgi:ADP-ribose pyrophosphatase YjhB (NUDIX family)